MGGGSGGSSVAGFAWGKREHLVSSGTFARRRGGQTPVLDICKVPSAPSYLAICLIYGDFRNLEMSDLGAGRPASPMAKAASARNVGETKTRPRAPDPLRSDLGLARPCSCDLPKRPMYQFIGLTMRSPHAPRKKHGHVAQVWHLMASARGFHNTPPKPGLVVIARVACSLI